ncbi:MAG: signal peptidase II [Gemmatimonadales bacterium]
MTWTRKARYFWPVTLAILLTDCATKRVAEEMLVPAHLPHAVLGDLVRLTLTYNPGGAMSLSFGSYSRPILTLLAVVALLVLGTLYRRFPSGLALPATALALVTGGALGNALDRLRSTRGVVDFIDIGLGATRFWIFNVADVAITLGAILLAFALSRPTIDRTHTGTSSRPA